jgi:hypothetical protein
MNNSRLKTRYSTYLVHFQGKKEIEMDWCMQESPESVDILKTLTERLLQLENTDYLICTS